MQIRRLLPLLTGTVLLGAQAPPEGAAAYSVAYVDIALASRTEAITAIKQAYERGFRKTLCLALAVPIGKSWVYAAGETEGPGSSRSRKRRRAA